MKVLCILGSPRKNGNSESLAREVLAGAEKCGAVTEIIRLSELSISPCVACGGCEKTGICVIADDMQELYRKVDSAERIIIASPIYFYGVTAQTKAFIDRCQAFWSRRYLLKVRVSDWDRKNGYFLGVCATKGERIFEGAVLSVQYAFDAMDVAYGGELLVRGVDSKGSIVEKPDELRRAREFGCRIAGD